ncbi:MAG: hypothetical protein ABI844_16860 [Saprospiraceae bacterium]
MKNTKIILVLCLGLNSISGYISGQTSNSSTESKENKEESFSFGNISPVILSNGKVEATNTASLTSYWLTSNFGNVILDRYRITRFENNININYGISTTKRWDIGGQLKYSRLRLDEQARNSPLKVFEKDDGASTSFTGLSMAGLRLRAQPFAGIPALTLQATVNFPILKPSSERTNLNADRILTDLVSTYFKDLSSDLYIFLQARYILQIANQDNKITSHFPGMSAYVVKSFLDQRLFVFPGLAYIGSYAQYHSGGRLNNQAQFVMAGVGAQFQFSQNLGLFLFTQKPLIYTSKNVIYSDIIKSSYTDFSLGVRVLL